MPMSFVGRENEIALLAVRAMLYEVCATPKPGLVDGITTGAHQDMNIFTFIDSSIEIYPYLASCAKLGLEYDGYNLGNLFEKIRAVGIQGERAMFAVTDGVNTQKGLLFCLGILSTAVGYALRDSYRASLHAVIASLKGITNGLVDKELKKTLKDKDEPQQSIRQPFILSKGEKVFLKYGVTGIRGEVEQGFPTVIKYGLPELNANLKNCIGINSALINTLLKIMTVAEDSNVLWRAGNKGLAYMRKCAGEALNAGGMSTDIGRKIISDMDTDFVNKNISPGGSADLLAVTVYFHLLDKEGFVLKMR